MSAIENTSANHQSSNRKLIKKETRVDLTPMVDLGFLLITFFVFTTQMSQPTAMNLYLPNDNVEPGDKICASCVLTVLLTGDDVIQYYEGIPSTNTIVAVTDFSANGIRKIIIQKRNAVREVRGRADEFVMIIKASNESSFRNFVDILDEVKISNVKHYYLSGIDAVDSTLFSLK